MNKKIILLLLSLVMFVFLFISCNRSTLNNKYVDIYDIVKKAFLTDKGYTDDLSKYMSNDVFRKINIYNAYPVNSPEYKKPFKINFDLREVSQIKDKDIIYVKMIYSVDIKDSQNKTIGGSHNTITFSVKKDGNAWYIFEKEEPA